MTVLAVLAVLVAVLAVLKRLERFLVSYGFGNEWTASVKDQIHGDDVLAGSAEVCSINGSGS